MQTRTSIQQKSICLGLMMVLCATATGAQQPITALTASMAANAKQLKLYTCKQRTATHYKGDLKSSRIEEIHYSASGERVSIPIDGQRVEQDARRRGPGSRLVAKKIESKQEEMREYIERLMSLTSRYLAPNSEKFKAGLGNAEMITSAASTQARIVMRNYVKNGDTMTMTFDAASHLPVKTEVDTSLDEDAVSIVVNFGQVHNGPSYPEKTVVTSFGKQLEVRVFTYDYRM